MNTSNLITLISWSMITLPTLTGATSTEDPIFTWISAIISMGGFLLMVINYCINWYRNAKSDGKITAKEVAELTENLTEKVKELEKQLEEKNDEDINR